MGRPCSSSSFLFLLPAVGLGARWQRCWSDWLGAAHQQHRTPCHRGSPPGSGLSHGTALALLFLLSSPSSSSYPRPPLLLFPPRPPLPLFPSPRASGWAVAQGTGTNPLLQVGPEVRRFRSGDFPSPQPPWVCPGPPRASLGPFLLPLTQPHLFLGVLRCRIRCATGQGRSGRAAPWAPALAGLGAKPQFHSSPGGEFGGRRSSTLGFAARRRWSVSLGGGGTAPRTAGGGFQAGPGLGGRRPAAPCGVSSSSRRKRGLL